MARDSTTTAGTTAGKGGAFGHARDGLGGAACYIVRVTTETLVRQKALELGFSALGIARADVALEEDFARYEAFVEAGMHGEMSWLAEHRDVRRSLDSDAILPGAKSVVCLAWAYQRSREDEARDPELAQLIARYARGRDYHNFVKDRLKKLAHYICTLGVSGEPVRARALCDTAPVLERAWAARSGLGFIGKHGLLIVPGLGSMVLLGEVVTTLDLSPGSKVEERCGSCTRCLDVCPTQAFPKPFVLDARRCVAYLTIEHRSDIPEAFHEGIGEHLFGCDDCQTVCPFNASSRPRAAQEDFRPSPAWSDTRLEDLAAIGEESWDALTRGSPVRRARREGLTRNAEIVLKNRGRTKA